jgi:hypothetical protein
MPSLDNVAAGLPRTSNECLHTISLQVVDKESIQLVGNNCVCLAQGSFGQGSPIDGAIAAVFEGFSNAVSAESMITGSINGIDHWYVTDRAEKVFIYGIDIVKTPKVNCMGQTWLCVQEATTH